MRTFILSAFLLTILATGCDSSSGGEDARVRLIQASTMGQPLSLFLNEELNATLLYGDVGSYDDTDAVLQPVRGHVAGADVFSMLAGFNSDTDYSIVTVQEGATTTPVIIVDDNTPPDFGNASLRAINAASRAPFVDLYALREGDSVIDHEPNFSALQFKQASNYDQIDRHEYVLWATAPGTKTVLAQAPSQEFKNQETWSVIVEDDMNSSGIALVLAKDRDGDDFNF